MAFMVLRYASSKPTLFRVLSQTDVEIVKCFGGISWDDHMILSISLLWCITLICNYWTILASLELIRLDFGEWSFNVSLNAIWYFVEDFCISCIYVRWEVVVCSFFLFFPPLQHIYLVWVMLTFINELGSVPYPLFPRRNCRGLVSFFSLNVW